MDFIGKKYKYFKGDSLEEFFRAVGIQNSPITTNLAKDFAAPITELVKNPDGTFTLTVGPIVRTFMPGKEVDEDMQGVSLKTTYTLEAKKLTQMQRAPNGKVLTFLREFTPTTLTVTNTVTGWDGKCVRYYETA